MKNEIYNLIYVLKKNERGSGLHAQYLAATYPHLFNAINASYAEIPQHNRIWLLHKPSFYAYSLIARKDDINCIRMEHIKSVVGTKATNGYSYFKRYLCNFDCWIPTIYDSSFGKNDSPSIGYYARDMRRQSNAAFIDFVQKLPETVPIVTMGTKELIQQNLAQRKYWRHTYSNEDFWKSCSHYFYYQPSDFEDPFPHTLLEAIQSKHRIISIKDAARTFIDGIDDLLSCIEYDNCFIPSKEGLPCEVLSATIWQQYIETLVKSKFQIRQEILSYGFLYDWACKNLR